MKCECGGVQGVATDISPETGKRIVCYCDDCQAFANYLGRADSILDEYGGTDIFQTSPNRIRITKGNEHIRCMRLTPKGLHRWYAGCCKTPIGNTLSAGVPFVGVIHNFMDNKGSRDQDLGPVLAYVLTKFAKASLPEERKQPFPLLLILKTISRILVWKIKGMNRPSPFFHTDGTPISEPEILNKGPE